MIEEKYKYIIDSLVSATQSDKIQWSKTSRDSEFIVNIGSGSISIDNYLESNINLYFATEVVSFAILNDIGEPITRILSQKETDSEDYEYLKNFYILVQNSYLKADKTINSMMDFLHKLK